MTTERFATAYSRGFELTTRFLVSRGLKREDACEIAQAAWVKGWERLAQLRDDRFVFTWVNTIALNVYRKAVRTDPLSRTVQDCAERISNLKTTSIDLAAIDVSRVLALCRPSDRLLLCQQMRGVTAAEIATEHGLTQTAIRIRLLRARRDARSKIENKCCVAKVA